MHKSGKMTGENLDHFREVSIGAYEVLKILYQDCKGVSMDSYNPLFCAMFLALTNVEDENYNRDYQRLKYLMTELMINELVSKNLDLFHQNEILKGLALATLKAANELLAEFLQ